MPYCDYCDCAAFIAAARARGIGRAAIAWQEEYGQVPAQEAVDYRRLRLAWLLAYDPADGRILRCALAGEAADRAALRQALEQAGFAVEERCRNLTAFGLGAARQGPRSG